MNETNETMKDASSSHAYEHSSFLSKLRCGAELAHSVTFKVRDGDKWIEKSLFMRLLTIKEKLEIENKVQKTWCDIPEQLRLPIEQTYLLIKYTLEKACAVPKEDQSLTLAELDFLVESQLFQLYKCYTDLCEKFDPPLEQILNEEQYLAILEDLEKKKVQLSNLSRYELELVTRHLILERMQLMDKLVTFSSAELISNDAVSNN